MKTFSCSKDQIFASISSSSESEPPNFNPSSVPRTSLSVSCVLFLFYLEMDGYFSFLSNQNNEEEEEEYAAQEGFLFCSCSYVLYVGFLWGIFKVRLFSSLGKEREDFGPSDWVAHV